MHREVLVSHVDKLLSQITGNPTPDRDGDGDWPFNTDRAVMYVRVYGDPDPNVAVWAEAIRGVSESKKTYAEINELNKTLRFARAYMSGGSVIFAAELVGATLDMEELKNALDNLASAADYFAPKFVETCGGQTLRTPDNEPTSDPPPGAPGYL